MQETGICAPWNQKSVLTYYCKTYYSHSRCVQGHIFLNIFTDLLTSVVLVLKQYFLLLIPDKDMQDCIKFISSPAVSFYAVS